MSKLSNIRACQRKRPKDSKISISLQFNRLLCGHFADWGTVQHFASISEMCQFSGHVLPSPVATCRTAIDHKYFIRQWGPVGRLSTGHSSVASGDLSVGYRPDVLPSPVAICRSAIEHTYFLRQWRPVGRRSTRRSFFAGGDLSSTVAICRSVVDQSCFHRRWRSVGQRLSRPASSAWALCPSAVD